MRGLKTQESEQFKRFWQLIQDAAADRNCVFFGYAGDGSINVTFKNFR